MLHNFTKKVQLEGHEMYIRFIVNIWAMKNYIKGK